MSKRQKNGLRQALSIVAMLAGASGVPAADPAGGGGGDANVRFHGAPTYDFGVTNVKWEAGTEDYSCVTFDLSWSFSWRVKWMEPAKTSATGKDMEVENWDAAWVFVKFLPEKDSKASIERNHWQHATLDKDAANHVMPAGATNTVKLSDDGTRGMGVFIYRDAIGHGANDWKNIKLRWLHPDSSGTAGGSGRFNPAKAAVNVHAIAMVYVPAGPFKVGSGRPSGIFQEFADGPDMPLVQTMNNGRSKDQEYGGLTDGSWRGGPSIPFLLDAEWDGPAAEGTRARRFGISAGELWGTHTYWEVNVQWIGGPGVLNDEYPTGYEAFYCMKYDLTQGQYVDFLNSLPPDVAAERAFVGSAVGSDAGIHSAEITVNLGRGYAPYTITERGGCTITSSADLPEKMVMLDSGAGKVEDLLEEDKEEDAVLDNLLSDLKEDAISGGKGSDAKDKSRHVPKERPVYAARLPFRWLPGPTPSDTIAYAVWAGMRPMSQLEGAKAGTGVRDPLAPPDWTSPKDLEEKAVLLDEGLPTERYLKGNHHFGNSMATRVGCRSTPTSDRGTALATYWGISELKGPVMPLTSRGFRGTHGNGMTSPGDPGASYKRVVAKFKDAPEDWPEWGAYLRGHFVELRCRLVVSASAKAKSADNGIKKPAGEEPAREAKPKPAAPIPPLDGRQEDLPRIANVKVEPGKEFSTVSFDLAWKNSWRAKWTEPADQNCTGNPLTIESWDAAWVFLKFRRPDTRVFSHATLSPDAAHHVKPAGAALDIGLSDDGARGVGVFVYRDTVGQGANEFKGIKLRWQNGLDQADAATAELSVHPIAMVYVPEGSFRSKSPFTYLKGARWIPEAYECQLMTIDTPDPAEPGGHANFFTNSVRESPDWPNGYGAFYCMKYSISQGDYAGFLTEAAPDPKAARYNAGQYGYLPWNASRRYAPKLYGLCGYTIRYITDEYRYETEAPERPAKFLSDPDILSFTAWAGLRPLTCLEYEKACRGPRAVARDEDAWAPGACAPAAGLARFVPSLGRQEAPATGRLAWPGASYWGIRDLSQSGSIIEWPAVVREDGRGFPGNHGTGSPEAPRGWVFTSRGEWYALGSWQGFPLSQIGVWLLLEDHSRGRMPRDIGEYISTRSGRYGARAVRTAPLRVDPNAPLRMDTPPSLVGYDIAIFNLSGIFRNDADKPLKVELTSQVPDACFPGGAASRTFTARPKAATPFKILTALTIDNGAVALRGGRNLAVQACTTDGDQLDKQLVGLTMTVAKDVRPTAIRSLEGGEVALRILNATDQPRTVALALAAPQGVDIKDLDRSVAIAAGAKESVVFRIPRQAFPVSGVHRMPCRVVVDNGAPQSAFVLADLQARTRWWLALRMEEKPELGDENLGGYEIGGAFDVGDIMEDDRPSGMPADLFTRKAPPKDWKEVVCGGKVPLGSVGELPVQGSAAIAATHVISPTTREVVLDMEHGAPTIGLGGKNKRDVRVVFRAWINGALVYDSRKGETGGAKHFTLKKGANTVAVSCRLDDAVAAAPGDVSIQFLDAGNGKPVGGLIFDIKP